MIKASTPTTQVKSRVNITMLVITGVAIIVISELKIPLNMT